MLITPSGKITDVNPKHELNAQSPIEVTLFGIVIELREKQPENAL
jgi:hypothetical protein